MAEGARLESVYTLTAYRGFESLLLRQTKSSLQHGCGGHKRQDLLGFEPEIHPIDRFDKEREATQRESRSDERAKPGNPSFTAR